MQDNEKLADYIASKGLSAKEFAKQIGKDYTTIAHQINGTTKVSSYLTFLLRENDRRKRILESEIQKAISAKDARLVRFLNGLKDRLC